MSKNSKGSNKSNSEGPIRSESRSASKSPNVSDSEEESPVRESVRTGAQSGKRSGKKFIDKSISIPDDIEQEIVNVFKYRPWFPRILKKAAQLAEKGGSILSASSEDDRSEERRLEVPKGTDLLIQIEYKYANDIYRTYDALLFLYAYDEKHKKTSDIAGRQIMLLRDEKTLISRFRRIKIGDRKPIVVKDHLYSSKAHEFLNMDGIMIKPISVTRGLIIIKLTPEKAIKIADNIKELTAFQSFSNQILDDFYKEKSKVLWSSLSSLVKTLLKERKPKRPAKFYMYLLPALINEQSGETRYLVPEFLYIMNMFFTNYLDQYNKLFTNTSTNKDNNKKDSDKEGKKKVSKDSDKKSKVKKDHKQNNKKNAKDSGGESDDKPKKTRRQAKNNENNSEKNKDNKSSS